MSRLHDHMQGAQRLVGQTDRFPQDDQIFLDLYATAESDARWTPMLDTLCNALSVRSAVVQVIQEAATTGWETWTARDTHSLLHAELHDRSLNCPDSPRFRLRAKRYLHTEVSSDHRAYGTTEEIMRDLQRRVSGANLGIGLWASFPIGDGRTFSLTLHRHPDDMRDIEEAEDRYLRRLLPHLQQAVRCNAKIGQLQSRADTLSKMSSHLQMGVLLCRVDLSIDWCNAAAVEVLAQTSLLASTAGRFRCTRQVDANALRNAVQAVAAGKADVARLVLLSEDGVELHIRVTRTDGLVGQPGNPRDHAPIALTISLPSARTYFNVDDVALFFGLSPAEANLAAALAGGSSVAEYAAMRGISIGTARVQLNRILSKTGLPRQAELVRVIQGSSAARRARVS
ncbi:MAG: helix-turn-helix transcriptional regulator [Sphingobium sp.]